MTQPNWIITSAQLADEIKNVVLVDVREQEEFDEAHIQGCTLIPLGELQSRAPRELKDPDANIVVYCAHGYRSMQGVMALRQLGYPNTRSLEGGIEAWFAHQGK